ncbi:hypothetical protein FA95DRAFT_1182928 [Auriscalpium vulgare]|uniref:Uncharacterized protein n=1 Tax=Auriscalpium vulgare TaxID=40419 RepID=A0ACB8RVI7_9AGAM|nr:hypothetical protein FA95DRAFT_1182928 [Auriscalpium vulgare]
MDPTVTSSPVSRALLLQLLSRRVENPQKLSSAKPEPEPAPRHSARLIRPCSHRLSKLQLASETIQDAATTDDHQQTISHHPCWSVLAHLYAGTLIHLV